MLKSKKLLTTSVLTGLLAVSVGASVILPFTRTVAAEYVVDFTQGSYNTWDGSSYTFEWYESPTINEDGVTVYTITCASDLAGLAIITNDLSGAEYADITANIATEDSGYIALCETFDGCVIELDCDIDLGGFDWLPISYPWKTANLTADYEFTNTEGNVVKYNGVDHIPDDLVDTWVGDENGNPISTRYWEYPESDLRFRDYINTLNFDSTHMQVEETESLIHGKFYPHYATNEDNSALSDLKYGSITTVSSTKWMAFIDEYVEDEYGVTEAMYPYTLKNIEGYTETEGFSGTFDGKTHKIIGLHPETPWTDDYNERLNTYDPIGKGLFSMIGKNGTVKNTNVKGEYTADDVVSYSGLLCAYNYGIIDTCYVEGTMEQGLVTMYYPVNKDYGINGTSVYKLSDTEGTVMPLGNSGFMSSQNYGTINNCYTVGAVTQAYRQFGFMASSNYGIISGCENRADFSTQEKQTDFITDEWCWDSELIESPVHYNGMYPTDIDLDIGNFGHVDIGVHPGVNDEGELAPMGHFYMPDMPIITTEWLSSYDSMAKRSNALYSVYYIGVLKTKWWEGYVTYKNVPPYSTSFIAQNSANAFATGVSKAAPGSAFCDGIRGWDDYLWTPALYETLEGESVAANHLYGVYTQTATGGITAINHGTVQDSTNKGNITTMHGTSPRNNFNAYEKTDTNVTKRDYYSYIRPNNVYGLFATAVDTFNYAGGIAAINLNKIENSVNEGIITERTLTDVELCCVNFDTELSYNTDFMVLTDNNFYQNGVYIEDADGSIVKTGWGLDWWVTTQEEVDAINAYCAADTDLAHLNNYVLNRNMPYPFVYTATGEVQQMSAGVTALNVGDLVGNIHKGTANHGICETTQSLTDTAVDFSRNRIDTDANSESNMFDLAINTDIVLNSVDSSNFDLTAIGNTVVQNGVPMDISTNSIYNGSGAFDKILGDSTRIRVEDNAIYDTVNTGYGFAATMSNCDVVNYLNLQNSDNGVSDMTACSLANIYCYGDNTNGIGSGTLISADTLHYAGTACEYALGAFEKMATQDTLALSNISIAMFKEDGTLGVATKGIAPRMAHLTINNLSAFMNFTQSLWDAYYCDFTDIMFVGDSLPITSNNNYVFVFEDCTCTNMLLQPKVNLEYIDYSTTNNVQYIPGMLKAVEDTNTFIDCVIQVPDGALSFPTVNAINFTDNTIKSDFKMSWDINARESGALAYYKDKGYTETRTYDYTVASEDSMTLIAEDLLFVEYDKLPIRVTNSYKLPTYTRKIRDNATEKPYYAFNIPYTGDGVGEVKGSLVKGDVTYSTQATGVKFPKTTLFTQEGDVIDLSIITLRDEFALAGLTLVQGGLEQKLESEVAETETYKYTKPINTTNADTTLISLWDSVYTIEIDDSLSDWIQVVPSSVGALPGQEVRLTTFVLSDDVALDSLYYCKYVVDENNRRFLDLTNRYDINMTTAAFYMPSADIKVFAESASNMCSLTEFVLAGVQGVIDGTNVTVYLDSTVDLQNISPDRITVSEGASVSPSVDTAFDFTKNVKYVVTAPSGIQKTYTVIVIPITDGDISSFELLGRKAVIQNTDINVKLPEGTNVTSVIPAITWSGVSITPNDTEAQDFTQPVVYTVVSSTGIEKRYTVTVEFLSGDNALLDIQLSIEGTPLNLEVDTVNKMIYAYYDYGMDASSVYVDSMLTLGDGTNFESGTYLNLTQVTDLLIYTNIGTTEPYGIVGVERDSTAKYIKQFTLYGYDGTIDDVNGLITVTLPSKYDITNIAPDAIYWNGKAITSVIEKHNFEQNVVYTVTAYDGTEKSYTVKVMQE